MRQTLFTPTYNRADTLPRLYDSIKQQTFKDFLWLIIDDGSNDNTKEVVDSFISEGIVSIKYIHKENGGKHTAQRLAYQIAETPYITEIDSDDTLMIDALKNFEDAWVDIEEHANDIAKVSMFVECEDGTLFGYGNFCIAENTTIDAYWHDYVLKRNIHKEFVSSINVKKFNECVCYCKYEWNNRKPLKYLGESIIWSSIGRKYKTRILMKVGRKYYTDAVNSILRGNQNFFNNMINHLYFIEDNIDYFWWNPRYFLGEEKMMISDWSCSEITFFDLLKHIHSLAHKVLFLVSFIPFFIYIKNKK